MVKFQATGIGALLIILAGATGAQAAPASVIASGALADSGRIEHASPFLLVSLRCNDRGAYCKKRRKGCKATHRSTAEQCEARYYECMRAPSTDCPRRLRGRNFGLVPPFGR